MTEHTVGDLEFPADLFIGWNSRLRPDNLIEVVETAELTLEEISPSSKMIFSR